MQTCKVLLPKNHLRTNEHFIKPDIMLSKLCHNPSSYTVCPRLILIIYLGDHLLMIYTNIWL